MDAGRCFASATRCTRACSSALSRTEYTLDRNLFGRVGTTFQVERQVGPSGGPGVDAVEVSPARRDSGPGASECRRGVGVTDEVLTPWTSVYDGVVRRSDPRPWHGSPAPIRCSFVRPHRTRRLPLACVTEPAGCASTCRGRPTLAGRPRRPAVGAPV